MPGGTVKAGQLEFTLRTMGRVTRVAEIEQIAVDNRGGHTITIGDLGRVEDGAEEIKSLARYNDTPTVLLNVRKQSGTNTVEVARLLKKRLAELQKSAPQGPPASRSSATSRRSFRRRSTRSRNTWSWAASWPRS